MRVMGERFAATLPDHLSRAPVMAASHVRALRR
jgi:hypothetical protein